MAETIDIVIPAYNAGETIHKPVGSSINQKLPKGWGINIIVVDDGSTDSTARVVAENFKEKKIRLISHSENSGRASACNTGWKAGQGSYVVFLDADCEWHTSDSLSAHIEVLEAGNDASIGSVTGDGNTFWDLYQRRVQILRERDFNSGNFAALTSANLAVRRTLLNHTEGFDQGYSHYGFEDRDLFLRLQRTGAKMAFSRKALVIHNLNPSLTEVCRKMRESGQYSSMRFRSSHPEYYSNSRYGKIDADIKGFPFNIIALIAEPLIPMLAWLGERIIRVGFVPFYLKRAWVIAVSGLSYIVGTYRKNTLFRIS